MKVNFLKQSFALFHWCPQVSNEPIKNLILVINTIHSKITMKKLLIFTLESLKY
jgi:hypothetical protein